MDDARSRVDEELGVARALLADGEEGQVDHDIVGAGEPFVRVVAGSDAHTEIVLTDEVHPEHHVGDRAGKGDDQG